MTLEDDIIGIMLQFPKMEVRPSQVREALKKLSGYKGRDPRGLDVNIHSVFEKLVGADYVKKKTVGHACVFYKLTEEGKKYVDLRSVHNIASVPPQKLLEVSFPEILKVPIDMHDVSDVKTFRTIDDIQPEGSAPVQVSFWLDQENEAKVDAVVEGLKKGIPRALVPDIERMASHFALSVKEALTDAKELRYTWKGPSSGPIPMRKLVKLAKGSLNFDAMVCFRFNGKQIAANIDWSKYEKLYENPDKEEEEKYGKFKKGVNKKGDVREAWIEWEILKKADKIQQTFAKEFLTKVFFLSLQAEGIREFAEGKWKSLTSEEGSQNLLIGEVALPDLDPESLRQLGRRTTQQKHPSPEECKATLKDLIKKGVVQILPLYLYRVDMEKARKIQQRDVRKVWEETSYSLDDSQLVVSEMRRLHEQASSQDT